MSRFDEWLATSIGSAVSASVIATFLIGGAVLTAEYRMFQGPGTNQLVLIWGWAEGWWMLLGSPMAIVLGVLLGSLATRMQACSRFRTLLVMAWASCYAISYALLGWWAFRKGLGSTFELTSQLIPVGLITGTLVGALVAWRATRPRLLRHAPTDARPALQPPPPSRRGWIHWMVWLLGLTASLGVLGGFAFSKGGPGWYPCVFVACGAYCLLATLAGLYLRRTRRDVPSRDAWRWAFATTWLGVAGLVVAVVVVVVVVAVART